MHNYYMDSNKAPYQTDEVSEATLIEHALNIRLIKISKDKFDGLVKRINTPTKKQITETTRKERDFKFTYVYSPAIQQLTRWIDNNQDIPDALAHYTQQRDAWYTWADALCALPDQTGFPWPEGEVPWPEQPPRPTSHDARNKG